MFCFLIKFYLLCCTAAGAAIISDEWQRSLQESVDNSRHLIQTLKKKCTKRKVLFSQTQCSFDEDDSQGGNGYGVHVCVSICSCEVTIFKCR